MNDRKSKYNIDTKNHHSNNVNKEQLNGDNTNYNDGKDNVSDSGSEDFSIEHYNNNSAYDHYAEEPITTEGIYAVPDIVKHYAYDIRDVEGDGNCGWYVIQEGLMVNEIACEYEMNISFSLTLSPPRTNCFFGFARSHSRVLVSLWASPNTDLDLSLDQIPIS